MRFFGEGSRWTIKQESGTWRRQPHSSRGGVLLVGILLLSVRRCQYRSLIGSFSRQTISRCKNLVK